MRYYFQSACRRKRDVSPTRTVQIISATIKYVFESDTESRLLSQQGATTEPRKITRQSLQQVNCTYLLINIAEHERNIGSLLKTPLYSLLLLNSYLCATIEFSKQFTIRFCPSQTQFQRLSWPCISAYPSYELFVPTSASAPEKRCIQFLDGMTLII